jgi:hypothetical protein
VRRVSAVAIGLLIGLSGTGMAVANAQPAQPDPNTTSTTDELTDMVLDVIEHSAAPATTPAPAPQN